ncbi:hypothetical protein AAFF_G00207110 [Aldrovandia affinis]|uniref:Uncharacterized protein n=1 Tax=Aldrovandia affinis TaxID=143900 RepID=A0AAD7RHN9_9TELE|nr:hypothetical protein AAFF_G00207110 [Aldrovandia affinis]
MAVIPQRRGGGEHRSAGEVVRISGVGGEASAGWTGAGRPDWWEQTGLRWHAGQGLSPGSRALLTPPCPKAERTQGRGVACMVTQDESRTWAGLQSGGGEAGQRGTRRAVSQRGNPSWRAAIARRRPLKRDTPTDQL